MPINAEHRRVAPIAADVIRTGVAALLRTRVLDAVATAQGLYGGPVTSQEARTALAEPVARHARAFTGLAFRVAELGPDERGRVLRPAGRDRKGFALWWVEVQSGVPSGPAA